jgi:ligand-binding sensor domain-containing protein
VNWINYNTGNSPIPHNTVSQIVEDNFGNIWASTYDGLAKFDGVGWTVYDSTNNGIALNNLFGMTYDKVNDYLWLTKPGKLIRYDGTNWTFWSYGPYAMDMSIDSFGNIWQAHYDGGISKFDGSVFQFFDTTNSPLPNNSVWTIDVSPTNEVWVTSAYGLSRFDGINWTIFDTSNTQLISNYTTAVTFDNNGLVWIHGLNGSPYLLRFDGSTWNAFDTAFCMPPSGHCDMVVDQFNRKWIGSYGEGLSVLGDTSCTHFTLSNSQIPSDAILDVFISSSNVLWLASYGMGVIRLDLPVGIQDILPNNGIKMFPNPAENVTTVFVDHSKLKNIEVVNCMGEKIFEIENILQYQYDINLESAIPGLYFIRLTYENSYTETVKLVVQ